MTGGQAKPKIPESSSSTNNTTTKTPPVTNPSAAEFSGHRRSYPNPPELTNPDAATLKDQWRYAIRQYSRWYSQAWGSAILAGLSFFALGWAIKGGNPLPSFKPVSDSPDAESTDKDSKK